MRLNEIYRHLANNHESVVDYPLSPGEHLVSQETAQALANLCQSVAVNGLQETLDARADLMAALVSTMLPQSHPGWRKRSFQGRPTSTMTTEKLSTGHEPSKESTITSPLAHK